MRLRSACIAALLAATGWTATQAATLTTTFATPSTSGVSVAGTPSISTSTYEWTNTTAINTVVSHSTIKEVAIAPTATTAGLAYVYDVATTTRTLEQITYKEDYVGWNATLDGNTSGNEYLTLSGSFSSSLGTSLSLYLGAMGSYTGASSPFGSATPALPSYFLSLDGGASWTSLDSYNSSSPTNGSTGSFAGSGATTLTLSAGTPLSFMVAIFAGSGVDLASVSLSAYTQPYDTATQTVSEVLGTSKTMVAAELLSPIPEPDSYALMLAGLMAVGLRLRHRQPD
jgi:hypothetical protein